MTPAPSRERLHQDAVATLTTWRAPDDAQEQTRREYLELLASDQPCLFKGDFPNHVTAGVIVVDPEAHRVLLNLHRKARRWFAFGGHLEPDDADLAAAATREGVEESGYPNLIVDRVPVHLSRHPVPFCDTRGSVDHLDVRYAARPPAGHEPVVGSESLDLRWFPLQNLPTAEPDMIELIDLALRRLR